MSGLDGVTEPPPVPASSSGSTAGRSLRPDALPSDTAVRFVLLILAVATASLYLFQALWFVVRGGGFVDAVQRCGAAAGDLAGGLVGATSSELQRMSACRADVSREQAVFAVGGCLMVLGAAWLAYRWMPVWRQRRRHLVSPDSADGRALLDEVAALSAQAGLERSPGVRLDAANPAVQAYVYGAGNELRLAMTGGLVVQQVLDPPSFRAVLRHELAHIKNRDVPWTYYTVAAWWSFVALALVPIVAVFVVNDPKYVLQLGWRTGLLALLVALVAASVLRAREAYADATSVTWSSIADLDRVLAAQPASRARRPQLLRLHPSAHERRMLLAAPDRLFRADWFTAVATGVAAGTALASLESIASLVLPSRAVVLSLAVAPLIAVVACVTAWRVGLREAVRGRREPLALPLGLGLGVGLAVAPLLTFEAAAGGVANGRSGWAGYALWAFGMALATALVVRWVADSARVRVESMIRFATPRRALAGHVLAATVVIALLLACGHFARLLLVSLGPSVLSQSQLWQELPAVSIGFWPNLAPTLAVAAALAVPLLAWRDLGRTTPSRTASWPWRDDGGVAADRVDFPRLTRPHLLPILVVGVLATGTAAIALIAARILTPLLPDEIRHTDVLALAVGLATQGSVVAAALVATTAAAIALPRRWWPLALLAAAAATVFTGLAALTIIVAAGCGVLPSVEPDCSPPGWTLTRLVLLDTAARAAPLAFLLAAGVAVARSAHSLRGPYSSPATPAASAAALAPGDARRKRPLLTRQVGVGLAAVIAVAIWTGALNLRVLAVDPPRVAGPGYEVVLPVVWTAQVDPQSGQAVFVTIAQDVRVIIQPIPAAASPATDDRVNIGGRPAFHIATQQQGGVRLHAYDLPGPPGAYRILVMGTAASLEQRQDELTTLFDAVRWASD